MRTDARWREAHNDRASSRAHESCTACSTESRIRSTFERKWRTQACAIHGQRGKSAAVGDGESLLGCPAIRHIAVVISSAITNGERSR